MEDYQWLYCSGIVWEKKIYGTSSKRPIWYHFWMGLPSGKRLHSYWMLFSWVNHLFLWLFSSSHTVNVISRGSLENVDSASGIQPFSQRWGNRAKPNGRADVRSPDGPECSPWFARSLFNRIFDHQRGGDPSRRKGFFERARLHHQFLHCLPSVSSSQGHQWFWMSSTEGSKWVCWFVSRVMI